MWPSSPTSRTTILMVGGWINNRPGPRFVRPQGGARLDCNILSSQCECLLSSRGKRIAVGLFNTPFSKLSVADLDGSEVPPCHTCRRSHKMISAKAKAPMPRLRPSFTVILWGCSMALWPRMLEHVHSRVDGDVSVAALRMPAEAEPFVEAILAICTPLLTCRTQRSPSRPAQLPACTDAYCTAVRLADSTESWGRRHTTHIRKQLR